VVKQGLEVQVLFSGTRDRFDGYKALPSQLQHRDLPGGACQLVNLADRLLCGQLIRNLLHSEGRTAQTRLSGDLLGSAEPAAALRHLYRLGCQPPPVLYLVRDAGVSAPTALQRYYLKEMNAADQYTDAAPPRYYAPGEFAEEVIEAAVISDAEFPRLLYCHQEQVQYSESVPAQIGAVVVQMTYCAPRQSQYAASSSGAHTASSSRTGYGYNIFSNVNGGGSQPLPALPTRPAPCSFAPLDQYDSLRFAAWAGLCTNAGSWAVWDLVGMRAGIWFPSMKAIEADLEETGQTHYEAATLPSTDPDLPAKNAVGYFLPFSDFQSIREEGSSAPKRVPTFFGATWPLQLLQVPQRTAVPVDTDPSEAVVAQAENSSEDQARSGDAQHEHETDLPREKVASDEEGSGPESVEEDDGDGGNEEPEVRVDVTESAPPEISDRNDSKQDSMEVEDTPGQAECTSVGLTDAGEVAGLHGDGWTATLAESTVEQSAPVPAPSALEPSRAATSSTDMVQEEAMRPCLALHHKSGTLGLAFLTKQAFLVWYGDESQVKLLLIFRTLGALCTLCTVTFCPRWLTGLFFR
jgi:hypothetical protein